MDTQHPRLLGVPPQRSSRAPRLPRSELEVATQQLAASGSWHRARAAQEAMVAEARSREARMDLARHLEVLERQQESIARRTQEQLRDSARILHTSAPTRAVVAHRNAWFAGKVAAGLQRCGVDVVAQLDNGADAVGTVVAEQPDLLLVEDSLPMQPGADVVRLAKLYSPETVLAAHVAYDDRVAEMLDAGADAAYTRRVPPADVVECLVALL